MGNYATGSSEARAHTSKDEKRWAGQRVDIKASELKVGDIYIDRDSRRRLEPERPVKILQMTPLSGEQKGAVEIQGQTKEGGLLTNTIMVQEDNYFTVIRKER